MGVDMGEIVKTKVCGKCGGKLSIQDISENSCFTDHKLVITPSVVCKGCSVMAHGVDKEVFELARKLVTDFDFKYYTHLNPVDDGEEYCLRANTDGALPLARWILEQIELAGADAVPAHTKESHTKSIGEN